MPGHIVPKKLYILVFAALIVLTGLTTGVAFINLGKWNTVAALACGSWSSPPSSGSPS
jgi:hypothetical protein